MPLGKLIKEQEATGPSEEEIAAQAAEEARRAAEAQAAAAAEKAATQARLDSIEKAVNRGQQVRPPAPQPSEAYQAQQELGLTDEQILENPAAAVQAIAQQIASKQLEAYNQQVSSVLGNVVKRTHKAEVDSLRNHPYFDDLEDQLLEYFEYNPQAMIEDGAVKRKYNELVGENLVDLQRKAAEREAKRKLEEANRGEIEGMSLASPTVTRPRAVEPSIRPASPVPKVEKKKVELDPVRQEIMDAFNRHGANLDAEEWTAIETGKALPKQVAADYQVKERGRG